MNPELNRTSLWWGALVPVVLGLALASCTQSDTAPGVWNGVERDSAGIRLVENDGHAIWTAGTAWSLVHEGSIGVQEGPMHLQLGDVLDVDADDAGRIYVLDRQAGNVRVFAGDGAYLASVGRLGGGPGEFNARGISSVLVGSAGIYVPDVVSRRWNMFNADGGLVSSYPLAVSPPASPDWALLPGGDVVHRVFTGGMDRPPARDASGAVTDTVWDWLVRLDTAGGIIDTIHRFAYTNPRTMRDGGVDYRILFPEPSWGITSDGKIVSGITDTYRLEVRNAQGALEMIVSQPTSGDPLTTASRRRLVARAQALMRARGAAGRADPEMVEMIIGTARFLTPAQMPAFAAIVGGPMGSIWVQQVVPVDSVTEEILDVASAWRGTGSSTWDVFSSAGRFLGEVALPPRFSLRRVRGRYAYGVERDTLDVQRVVRLRIVMPDGPAQPDSGERLTNALVGLARS